MTDLFGQASDFINNLRADLDALAISHEVDGKVTRTEIEGLYKRFATLQVAQRELTDRLSTVEQGLDELLTPLPEENVEDILTPDNFEAYGIGNNETYGDANGSKHRHRSSHVMWRVGSLGVKLTASSPDVNQFFSGAVSSRELNKTWGIEDGYDYVRFEADVTLSDYNHAVWPAVWLRWQPGGASAHEVDMLEAFTAQTGPDIIRQTIHSNGSTNYLKDPYPGVTFPANTQHTIWYELHTDRTVRMGVDGNVTVDATDDRMPDPRSGRYDVCLQMQIGGNWVGDPAEPYNGYLQNGRAGKSADLVPSWNGEPSTMTIHGMRVSQHRSGF